jgi:hypothetical protein
MGLDIELGQLTRLADDVLQGILTTGKPLTANKGLLLTPSGRHRV